MDKRKGTLAAIAVVFLAARAAADDVARLRKVLEEGRASDIEDVAGDLWDLGPPAFEKVRLWLKEKDPKLRGCAMLALPGLDPKDDAGLIVAATQDPELRTAALRSLGGLRIVRLPTVRALTEAIAKGNETELREATYSCIRLPWPIPARVKDKELKAAIATLSKTIEKRHGAEDKRRRLNKPAEPKDPWRVRTDSLEVAKRVLEGKGRLRVAGHVAGRTARLARHKQARVHRAIDRGLQWLAAHQDVNEAGEWDCDEFHKHDPEGDKCDGEGSPFHNAGVTGLAVLAFLGAGHLPHDGGRYAKNVRQGLAYLRFVQEKGTYGDRDIHNYIYNHAIATLAMAEAWILTGHPGYRKSAERAVEFLGKARNRDLAWYYKVQSGKNGTSVTAWCTHAVRVADMGGIAVDPETWNGVRLWIEKMTDPEHGQIGYTRSGSGSSRAEGTQDRFPTRQVYALNGAGAFARLLCGEELYAKNLALSVGQCTANPPAWDLASGRLDMMYWYWGSLAVHQLNDIKKKKWRDWFRALQNAALKNQHVKKGTARFGSWDPLGPWGAAGGRVYSTAMMVLALETPFRYARPR